MRRKLVIAASALYAGLMLYLLFFQRFPMKPPVGSYWDHVRSLVNLVPFRTVKQLTGLAVSGRNPYWVRFSVVNLLGNVVMFIPLGFLLPCLFRRQRRFWVLLLTATGIVLLVEAVQALTLLGSGDVDDLLLNVPAAALGYGLWRLPPLNRFLERKGFVLE